MQTVSHRCWKYDMFFIWYQNTTFTQLLKHKVQDSACALRPQFSNILKQMLQALTLNTCQSALLHSHKLLNWSLKTKPFFYETLDLPSAFLQEKQGIYPNIIYINIQKGFSFRNHWVSHSSGSKPWTKIDAPFFTTV